MSHATARQFRIRPGMFVTTRSRDAAHRIIFATVENVAGRGPSASCVLRDHDSGWGVLRDAREVTPIICR